MSITTEEELRAMKAAGEAVSRVLEAMKREVRPGVTTAELDEVGGTNYARRRSAFRSHHGVPIPRSQLHQRQ
jgi:methionine aminopeptidase